MNPNNISSQATVSTGQASFNKGASVGEAGGDSKENSTYLDQISQGGSAAQAQKNPCYGAKTNVEYGATPPSIPVSTTERRVS